MVQGTVPISNRNPLGKIWGRFKKNPTLMDRESTPQAQKLKQKQAQTQQKQAPQPEQAQKTKQIQHNACHALCQCFHDDKSLNL